MPSFVHCGVYPLHALTLIPLIVAKVQLSLILNSLRSYDLVLWTDGSILFRFGKGNSSVLANCSLCGTDATLSFSAGLVCSSFSAEAYTILHLRLVLTPATSLPLLFSYMTLRSVLSFMLPFSSISLADLVGTVFSFSCFIRLQWVPRHSFLPGNNTADELARQGALFMFTVIPCSLSLISSIHSSSFLDWRHTV